MKTYYVSYTYFYKDLEDNQVYDETEEEIIQANSKKEVEDIIINNLKKIEPNFIKVALNDIYQTTNDACL